MLYDILLPFFTIAVAELADKTQLVLFYLASKTKKHYQLFFGAVSAFVVIDGISIIIGDAITKAIPMPFIKSLAGVTFIILGITTLLIRKKEEKEYFITSPFLTAFGLIFISEIGDKTQIAAGLFATRFKPVMVFIGAIAALTSLSIMAIYSGKVILTKINQRYITIIGGSLFIIIGLTILLAGII